MERKPFSTQQSKEIVSVTHNTFPIKRTLTSDYTDASIYKKYEAPIKTAREENNLSSLFRSSTSNLASDYVCTRAATPKANEFSWPATTFKRQPEDAQLPYVSKSNVDLGASSSSYHTDKYFSKHFLTSSKPLSEMVVMNS